MIARTLTALRSLLHLATTHEDGWTEWDGGAEW